MKQTIKKMVRGVQQELSLTSMAKRERAHDRTGLPEHDPGIDATVAAAVDWLCQAQDCSASADGGVARDFSLVKGWASSYPETTGYIVPTMLDVAMEQNDQGLRTRARRMLDWLVSIQYPDGGFQGGKVDAPVRVPVTFNTGQILLGLAQGVAEFGAQYEEPMHRAARWLVDTQDEDGAWRRYPTPFAKPGEKAYETHVAWGLLEAARVAPDSDYGASALRNVRWALAKQQSNGWFSDCCLSDPERPLTHTIGYVLRGIVEGWRFSKDDALLTAARLTADSLTSCVESDGWLSGQWSSEWKPAADWVCITGSVQIAHSLLLLYQDTQHEPYRDAARRLNAWARRTVAIDGPDGLRGGVKGSFPVDGGYGRFELLNWAAKFFIDSNRCERLLVAAVP